MKGDILRFGGIILLSLGLFSSSIIILSQPARADSWSEHFDGPNGEVFNPRWTKIGTDIGIQDGTTYFKAFDFDTGVNTSWHGPTIRAPVQISGDFNISAIFYCLAELDLTLGRADVRLLDPLGNQVFAFGWEDGSRINIEARVWLRGASDSQVIFNTGFSSLYSSFLTKEMRLSRSAGISHFFIGSEQKYSGDVGRANIAFVELSLLKYGGESECPTDVMYFDFITVSATPSTLPDAPTNLQCLPGASSANLSWSAPLDDGGAPVTGYKIYRGTTTGNTAYLTTIGAHIAFSDSALTNGMAYYYRVSALNAVGEGEMSGEASVVPMSVPGPPVGLQALGIDASVKVSWSTPLDNGGSDITGYRLYRTANSASTLVSETPETSFSDLEVMNGVTYSYAVTAVNAAGEGRACLPVSVIPGSSLSIPSSPRDIALNGGDGNITIFWNSPESNGNTVILNYTIYRGVALGSISKLTVIPAVNVFKDAGLINGVTYYYKLSATNSVGESPLSDAAACTPESIQPLSAPRNFNVTMIERNATLTWQAPSYDGGSPITGYRIYRSLSSGNSSLLVELGATVSYTDTELAWNTTFYYSVSALNSDGEGPQSEEECVKTNSAPNGQNQTEPPPASWTDYFNLTSSITTVIVMAIGIAIAYFFMRGDGTFPESRSKDADKAIDNKAQDDGADEEEEH